MRRCNGALYGPLIFMGITGNAIYQDTLYKIKKADEKKWIDNVIGRNKVNNTPINGVIDCPKEYQAYYEATFERRIKRLEKQLGFLKTRRNGLRDSIILVSSAGFEPQPGLEKAYQEYVIATAETESKLNGFNYLMKDFHVMEDTRDAEPRDT